MIKPEIPLGKRHILICMNGMLVLVASGMVALCCSAQSLPQAFSLDIVKLKTPEYPPIALAARVSGDVILNVTLLENGAPTVVEVKSGPQMLRQPAIESAKNSLFHPVREDQVSQVYQLTYRFSLESLSCGAARDQSYPRVKVESNTVIISEQSVPLCDPAADIRVRSAKCFFLWKCGLKMP